MGGTKSVDQRSTRIYNLSIEELESADKSTRIASFTVPRMTWAERVNVYIAHWL